MNMRARYALTALTDSGPRPLPGPPRAAGGCCPAGIVYLVGAGPGDPELLTLKALRLIEHADCVVHDRLVSAEVLSLIPDTVARFDVGKRCGRHTMAQADINALLVRLAGEGRRVVRLKGGDPFMFGRGGEEGACLAAAGIPFDVVPGITSATGCAAAARIPLTDRDHVHACTFVTGHLKDERLELDWAALARPSQTLVFYMGVRTAGVISRRLLEHGLSATTPVAIVENGTTARQRLFLGALEGLERSVAVHRVLSPALIIVGEVVRLAERLSPIVERAAAEIGGTTP